MKISFRPASLSQANLDRLALINSIIEEYAAQGLILTLRQLYYQLVSRDIIANQVQEYRKLSVLLVEGRMAGIVDWDAIEDRLRRAEKPSSWEDPKSIMESVIRQYARPRQDGQKFYVEVWVEKDALSGVLSRVTSQYHIPIMVNRGYSSASAMFDAYKRFRDAHSNGQMIRILYLGDHDPSGLDMIKDIELRILEFFFGEHFKQGKRESKVDRSLFRDICEDRLGLDFQIIPVALTREQIQEYNPPPNPAKMQDPRAGDYVAKHGNRSWEVDALRPEVLNEILTNAIHEFLDEEQYRAILWEEQEDKRRLMSLMEQL